MVEQSKKAAYAAVSDRTKRCSQLFLRARAHKFFGDRATKRAFEARSAERDAETDPVELNPSFQRSKRLWLQRKLSTRVRPGEWKMFWRMRRLRSEMMPMNI
jgi:hypothetical protein